MASNFCFQGEVKRLIAVYGVRYYPEERVKLIWEAVKNISDSNLTSMVDNFIADSDKPPMRHNFSKIINDRRFIQHRDEERKAAGPLKGCLDGDTISRSIKVILESMGNLETTKKVNSWVEETKQIQLACKTCDGSGMVFAKRKNTKYDNIAFKCYCDAGKEKARDFPEDNFPTWGTRLFADFEKM